MSCSASSTAGKRARRKTESPSQSLPPHPSAVVPPLQPPVTLPLVTCPCCRFFLLLFPVPDTRCCLCLPAIIIHPDYPAQPPSSQSRFPSPNHSTIDRASRSKSNPIRPPIFISFPESAAQRTREGFPGPSQIPPAGLAACRWPVHSHARPSHARIRAVSDPPCRASA